MQFNNNIPTDKETRWTAFLNGEPDISDVSNMEVEEMEDFTSVWEAAGTNFGYSAANPDQAWVNLLKERTESDKNLKFRIFKSRVLKYAAIIVVMIGVGFATYKVVQIPEKQAELPVIMAFAETEAHPVNLTVIILPDGSTVKMNASTRIEYPEIFAANVQVRDFLKLHEILHARLLLRRRMHP
ncbi:MAG: hypothetical protein NTY07_10190 [Bacteroidia bacterium]|nr:hypothetical protein [Bacteroidia bacterium]